MVERLKVFDEKYQYLYDENRDTIHEKGLWHETFHCWLMDDDHVYIQKRSADKKEFPNLYDITAAGHLLAQEEVMDGIREVEEEIGIKVDYSKLSNMGFVQDTIRLPYFIDNEFANVFLYLSTFMPDDFILQQEEVDSIHAVEIQSLAALFHGEVANVRCRNLKTDEVSEILLTDFVPHETEYFRTMAKHFVIK